MKVIIAILLLSSVCVKVNSQNYEKDIFPTNEGNLEITFIAHGTLMMEFNNMIIYIDPVTRFGTDYSQMPMADLILITHSHRDHLDPKAVEQIRKESSNTIATSECVESLDFADIMSNGDHKNISEIGIDAVPAYNLTSAFHPKGMGNGYVLQFRDVKVYVAGDTENIPEMSNLKDIDIAFLPMNLPYTMTPEMVAEAAKRFRPKILYPYHFGNTNADDLVNLLQNKKGIEVRIRKMN